MAKNANASSIKALKLLALFTEGVGSLSLDEISTMSGLPVATAFRMLNALVASGMIDVVDAGRGRKTYKLGLKLLALGQLVADHLEIRSVALPHMTDLRDEVQEAVHLVVRDRQEAVYVEKVETTHPVRLYTKVGRRAPLYAGACARALVAFLPEDEMALALDGIELVRFTGTTITERSALEKRLADERAQGYTESQGEIYEGTWAIAMPVRDHSGQVVAAVSIAGPGGSRADEVKLDALARCVDEISRDLGYYLRNGNDHF